MFKRLSLATLASALLAGCVSVPMESPERSRQAQAFAAPSAGHAGIYIYRGSGLGGTVKRKLWIDGECIGGSVPNVFFYQEVAGDQEHKISTESEFSPNHLLLKTESGKHYFIRQYIKLGVVVSGSDLEQVSEQQGRQVIGKLSLAQKGHCS